MSVKVRLKRTGAKNDPSFRVVAADSHSPRDGRFLEILGWYDPKMKGPNAKLNLERIDFWVDKGAQVSDTVRSLIKVARKGGVPQVDTPAPEAQVSVTAPESVAAEAAAEEVAEESAGEPAAMPEETAAQETDVKETEAEKSEV